MFLRRLLVLALIIFSHMSLATTLPSYETYMKKLIILSKQNPRYPFAAMIIDNKTGRILCSGVNKSVVNPTYHGEMVAINRCAAKHPRLDWSTTTLISNVEPCPMCSSAVVWTGISKVVYGTSIPFFLKHGWQQMSLRTQEVFDKSPFYHGTVIGGVLHKETDKVFRKAYS